MIKEDDDICVPTWNQMLHFGVDKLELSSHQNTCVMSVPLFPEKILNPKRLGEQLFKACLGSYLKYSIHTGALKS